MFFQFPGNMEFSMNLYRKSQYDRDKDEIEDKGTRGKKRKKKRKELSSMRKY